MLRIILKDGTKIVDVIRYEVPLMLRLVDGEEVGEMLDPETIQVIEEDK